MMRDLIIKATTIINDVYQQWRLYDTVLDLAFPAMLDVITE